MIIPDIKIKPTTKIKIVVDPRKVNKFARWVQKKLLKLKINIERIS